MRNHIAKKKKSAKITYSIYRLEQRDYSYRHHKHAMPFSFCSVGSFIVIIHKRNHVVCLIHCTLRTFFATLFPTDLDTLITIMFFSFHTACNFRLKHYLNHLPQHFVWVHCQRITMNLIFDWNQLALPPLFPV